MVAVITINYNLSVESIPCVESILKSNFQDICIYLIDNGSREEDFKKLENAFDSEPKVRILRIEKNCGYVGGVNYGLKTSLENNPEYFLIMNNDTIIDREAITHLVSAAKRHNDNAIVSGKVYYFDHPDVLQHTGEIITDTRYLTTSAPGRNEKDEGQFNTEKERDALDDVFWLLPLEVVKDVGFYSEYFFLYAEQGDYALRAHKKGYKLIFTPEAKIWHKESMTTGNGNAHALPVYYWRGQGIFMVHYRHLKTRYFILSTVKNLIGLSLKSVLKNKTQRKSSIALLRGYLWGIRWLFNKKPNDGANPYLKSIS